MKGLAGMAKNNLTISRPIGSRPPDECVKLHSKSKNSIFNINLCSTWIDEAHVFRGASISFFCAIQLRNNSAVVNCLTATPIWTGPRVCQNKML